MLNQLPKQPWMKALHPCGKHRKHGKQNARSLRRHYPVQVQRDFLSLTCLPLMAKRPEAEADTDTPGAFLMSIKANIIH